MVLPLRREYQRGKTEVDYFVTITARSKGVLDEQGPFGSIDHAIAYVIEEGYFLPPDNPHNNAYMAIDGAGVVQLYITRTTAGKDRIGPGVFAVIIRRSDRHMAKQQEYARKHRAH